MLRGVSELAVCPLNSFGCPGSSQPFGSILPSPLQSLDTPVRVTGRVHRAGRGPYARLRYALDICMVVGPVWFQCCNGANLLCVSSTSSRPLGKAVSTVPPPALMCCVRWSLGTVPFPSGGPWALSSVGA